MLFLSDAQLERARRDRSYPRRRIYLQLEKACARHLDMTHEHLRRMAPMRNLLSWGSFIGELSLMHAITDDEQHLDHVLPFVRSLAHDGWRDVEMTEHLHAPLVFSALAGFYDLHGPRLDDGDAEQLRDTMVAIAEYLWLDLYGAWGARDRTVWNHNAIAYATIGVAGLLLDGHRFAGEWLEVGTDRVRHFLEVGVTPAGMTWEGHHYCGYVFRQLGLFLQALTSRGLESTLVAPGSEHAAKMHRVPVWYAHDVFPRGRWLQNYNDSHWDPHSSLLGFLQSFVPYEPEICAAVWDRLVGRPGRKTFGFDSRFSSLAEAMTCFPSIPIKPLEELDGLGDHFFCPDVGYLSARDAWDDDASVFTFNSGPLNGRIHDHADNNSFTFIARGEPLVIDSGSANDPSVGSPSSALGHNLVFVDERGEGIAGGGAGVSGTILEVDCAADFVAVVGDATESYSELGYNPVRHALRHAVFVRQPVPYLVTYDDVDKDGLEHGYEYHVHVPAGESPTAPDEALTIVSNKWERVGELRALHPGPIAVASDPYETQRRPRGPYNQHVRWRLGVRAVNPHFVVLAAPQSVGSPVAIDIEDEASRLVVRLAWPHGTDEISFAKRSGVGAPVPVPTMVRNSGSGGRPVSGAVR